MTGVSRPLFGRKSRSKLPVTAATFITRKSCSLCAEALPVVARLTGEAQVPLTVLDVDADPGLSEWSDHVPVLLLDGVEHSRWWVDEQALKRALT